MAMMAASAIRAQTDARMIRPSSSGMWAKKMQAATKAMNMKIIADYCSISQILRSQHRELVHLSLCLNVCIVSILRRGKLTKSPDLTAGFYCRRPGASSLAEVRPKQAG